MEGTNPAVKQASAPASVGVVAPSTPLRPSGSGGQAGHPPTPELRGAGGATGYGEGTQALPKKAVPLEVIGGAEAAMPINAAPTPQSSPRTPASPPPAAKSQSPIANRQKPIADSQPPKPPQASTPPPAAIEGEEAEPDIELPDLTPELVAFLSSKRYVESDAEIKREFALSNDDLTFLNEMDHAVFGGLIDLRQYVAALREEFPNLNNEEKQKLIAALFAYRYVPFGADMNPSAELVAREQELVLPKTPYYRIYSKPLTYMGAAHEVARAAGIPLMGQTQERLRDIILSRVKGVRVDAQVESQLMHSFDMGGLGLKEEHARIATESIADIIRRATLVTEEEYSALLSKKIHEDVRPESASEADSVTASPEQAEEEKEIADIISKMPKAEQDTATVLAESIRNILDRLSWRPEDPYLQRRFTNMISTRLRDVRSRNEFFMKLMRDVKVGGLSLERKEAEEITNEIEAGYAEFRGNVEAEEKEKLRKQLEDQEKKIQERKRRESEEHAKWYEEKVNTKRAVEAEQKRAFEHLRVIAQGKTSPIEHPIEAKDKAKEKASFGVLVPTSSMKKTEAPKELIPPEPKTEKKRAEPLPRKFPARPVVKVSMETARIQQAAAGARPKIDDVQVSASSPRLTGPLQEIGSITLDQFRRLGRPKEATKHLEDKVDLLAGESFERRIAGVQAWQGSPLQKRYLALLSEAFRNGTTVKAFVEKKRLAGEEALTVEELEAIMALNNVLRL